MSRGKKIDVNSEGFKVMVQETYNDITHQKNEVTRLFKEVKKTANLDESNEQSLENVPLAGPTLVNLLKLIDLTVDKKLKLLKIFHTFLKDGDVDKASSAVTSESGNSLIPSGADRNELLKAIRASAQGKTLED